MLWNANGDDAPARKNVSVCGSTSLWPRPRTSRTRSTLVLWLNELKVSASAKPSKLKSTLFVLPVLQHGEMNGTQHGLLIIKLATRFTPRTGHVSVRVAGLLLPRKYVTRPRRPSGEISSGVPIAMSARPSPFKSPTGPTSAPVWMPPVSPYLSQAAVGISPPAEPRYNAA